MKNKRQDIYFLVTSYGRTATYWIAKNLNQHPDIVCSHGPSLPPVLPHNKKQPLDSYVLEMHKNLDVFLKTPVKEVLSGIRDLGRGKVYGNVHGYSANSVDIMFENNSIAQSDLSVVNIIRHPITRIESFKNRFHYELTYNTYFKSQADGYIQDMVDRKLLDFLATKYNMDFSLDTMLFLYSLCLVAFNDKLDLESNIISIPMERLTKDPEVFCWMFNILTYPEVKIDSKYLANVYSTERSNVLTKEQTSVETYSSWDGWMQAAFKFVMKKYDFSRMYNRLQYDLSFV